MKIIVSAAIFCVSVIAGTGAAPALKNPADLVLHRASAASFTSIAEGVSAWDISGGALTIRQYRFDPGARFSLQGPESGLMVIVLAGSGEIESKDGKTQSFRLCDAVFIERGATILITAGNEGARLVEAIAVPGFSGADTAELQTGYAPGKVIDYRTLQFIMPKTGGHGTVVRNIPFVGGRLSFIRLRPDEPSTLAPAAGDRALIVLRGCCFAGDSSLPELLPEDVACIRAGTDFGIGCGSEGCEVIEIVAAQNADYEALLSDRCRKLSAIVDPGERLALIADGSVEDPPLTTTEGPSWMNGILYFSNYGSGRGGDALRSGGIHAVFPDGMRRIITNGLITCGTTPLPNGNLAVCDIRDNRIAEVAPDGAFVRSIADTFDGHPFGMPNDLITDSRGGLYFTVPRLPRSGGALPGSAVYYLRPDGGLARVTGWNEFDVPNGCLVDADNRRFLLSCSRESTIWMFDIADDGSLSGKRPFATVIPPDNPRDKDRTRGIADGMTMDTIGNVYVATCHGIDIYDREGGYIGFMHFPVSPSHCVFGGGDLSTLFVTCKNRVYSIRLKTRGFEYPLR